MLTDDDHAESVESTPEAPLCDEDEFAAIVAEMVAHEAPRLFAMVQEYGERVDGRIAAWGMAFDAGHAEVVGVANGPWMRLRSPENAVRRFAIGSHVRARLVWCDPATAPPGDAAAGG